MGAAATALSVDVKKRKIRRFKTRPMNRKRNEHSVFIKIVEFAEKHDTEQFFKYTRMTPELFHKLLDLVGPFLQKDKTKNPISPKQRLALTLQ